MSPAESGKLSSAQVKSVLFARIAENNIEIQRHDHEKEVESLKEELKRLKEEKVGLQRQVEDAGQANADLQEQVVQLSKHVKLIPELNREISSLQNQRNSAERRMKQQSEQARGTDRKSPCTTVIPVHQHTQSRLSFQICPQRKW